MQLHLNPLMSRLTHESVLTSLQSGLERFKAAQGSHGLTPRQPGHRRLEQRPVRRAAEAAEQAVRAGVA